MSFAPADLFSGTFSTDIIAPSVSNNSPTGSGASKSTNISFDIEDTETGVDLTSLYITVDSVVAYNWDGVGVPDDGFQVGFDGPASAITGPVSGVYSVTIDPTSDFASYDTIPVTIDAQDLAPLANVMPQFSWSFQVEDYEAPYIANDSPSGTGIPVNTLVTVDVKDDGIGVDIETVIISIGGVEAYNWDGVGVPDDGFKTGFQGTSSAVTGGVSSYSFVIDADPDYVDFTSYTVLVDATDLSSNVMPQESWSFTTDDTLAPVVSNNFPTGVGTVPRDSNVSFDITDTGAGVDLTTLVVTIDGSTAYNWDGVGVPDDGFQVGYDGPSSAVTGPIGGTYSVIIDPTSLFDNYADVPITINASDLDAPPNAMVPFNWTFKTEDAVGPIVSGYSPTSPPRKAITSLVEFDVSDAGTGVDIESVIVTVGGVVAYSWNGVGVPNDGFKTGFQGTSSAVTGVPASYHFVIDADPDYAGWTTYEVVVTASDLS